MQRRSVEDQQKAYQSLFYSTGTLPDTITRKRQLANETMRGYMRKCSWGGLLIALLLAGGCTSAAQHRQDVQDDSGDRVTVGTVQKEIRIGMSGAEVAAALGSPNIVSTDEERREVWMYDKFATDASYSKSSGGIGALLIGIGSAVGGGVGGSANSSSGASSVSQRTLTIIIKFDENKLVRDFAYHTSRF